MSKLKFRGTNLNNKIEIAGIIISIILIIFLVPFITFWCGYFTGWIAKITIGTHLIAGLNTFHIPVTLEELPLFCGILAFISSFFKNSAFNSKKD